jgi:quercetin dioxygenase-like cupin family protein
MKVTPIAVDPAAVFVDMPAPEGTQVRMGCIRFRAGERVPENGCSLHEQGEYSYVMTGSLTVTSGGVTTTARAGDLISIPPGESHFTQVESDSSVVYLLIG